MYLNGDGREPPGVVALRHTAQAHAACQAQDLMVQQVTLGVWSEVVVQWPPDDPGRRQMDALLTEHRAMWARKHALWCQTCALAYTAVEEWPPLPVLTAAEVAAIRTQVLAEIVADSAGAPEEH